MRLATIADVRPGHAFEYRPEGRAAFRTTVTDLVPYAGSCVGKVHIRTGAGSWECWENITEVWILDK